MKTKAFFICGLFALGMVSCDLDKTEKILSDAIEEYKELDKPKVAEKKPAIFYQRLLEQFCQRYYDDAFNHTYHCNSLIVDKLDYTEANWKGEDIISWNAEVKARHSFEGFLLNHNDSPCRAYIEELGDNTYTVTFYIRRYDIFGDLMEDEECATRTITYYE